MTRRRIAGIGLLTVAVATIVGFVFLKASPRHFPAADPTDSLRAFIESTLKKDFWPESYQTSKETDLVRLGFGAKYAINYSLRWQKREVLLLAFVGYNKQLPSELIGYSLYVYVRGRNPEGHDLANRFLQNTPTRGWTIGKHTVHKGFESELATVIWKKNKDKQYLEVLALVYEQPKSGVFPDENVKEFSTVRLVTYLYNNPYYGMVEDFRDAAHSLYGTKKQ